MAKNKKRKTWGFKQELGRKIIHLFSILFLVVYFIFDRVFNEKIALMILTAILIVMIHLEFLRIEKNVSIPIINILWKYKRPEEQGKMGSEVFFLIGAIICLALFDIRIACAAILMTTFGDMASSVMGNRFHYRLFRKRKPWSGILAELLIDILVGFIVLRTAFLKLTGTEAFGTPIWPAIIIMAVSATLVESIVTKMDDNLLIPVVAGFCGQITLMLITWLGWI